MERGYKDRLFCIEYLTGWRIVVPTNLGNAEFIQDIVSTNIIHPFWNPKLLVIENDQCFMASTMKELFQQQWIQWNTFLSYAPLSNGREWKIVKTVKSGVSKLALNHGEDWYIHVQQGLYGYRRRPFGSGHSPFDLIYEIAPVSYTHLTLPTILLV